MIEGKQLTGLLGLQKQPVAVAFSDSAPEAMRRIEEPSPSGCTYWKYAAEGRSFYTQAEDHYGCPIGALTHGIDLPKEKARELDGLVRTMVDLSYLDPSEVAAIPRREAPFGVVLYAPLADATFEPDVVLVCGNAKQMMLLAEAAQADGGPAATSMMGRPTCAAIPAVMQSGRNATSLGCIGNRVYTSLSDDDLYFAIAGPRIKGLLEKLATIVRANGELEKFHSLRVGSKEDA